MADKNEMLMLYALAGLSIGAVAVFIYMSQTNRTVVTEFTRDANGHIVSVLERRL